MEIWQQFRKAWTPTSRSRWRIKQTFFTILLSWLSTSNDCCLLYTMFITKKIAARQSLCVPKSLWRGSGIKANDRQTRKKYKKIKKKYEFWDVSLWSILFIHLTSISSCSRAILMCASNFWSNEYLFTEKPVLFTDCIFRPLQKTRLRFVGECDSHFHFEQTKQSNQLTGFYQCDEKHMTLFWAWIFWISI